MEEVIALRLTMEVMARQQTMEMGRQMKVDLLQVDLLPVGLHQVAVMAKALKMAMQEDKALMTPWLKESKERARFSGPINSKKKKTTS